MDMYMGQVIVVVRGDWNRKCIQHPLVLDVREHIIALAHS